MQPDQFDQLMTVLRSLTPGTYTITGAADWPGIAAVGGLFIAAMGFMWRDLRASNDKLIDAIKELRTEGKTDLDKLKEDHEKVHKNLWDAIEKCQAVCCPRGHE